MDELDPMVIPMVEYFNANNLPTVMSCQGHNTTNQSMYWIMFSHTVREKEILAFMGKHLNRAGDFCSNGWFARNLIYVNVDGEPRGMKMWCYLAATIEAADGDLCRWKEDDARN